MSPAMIKKNQKKKNLKFQQQVALSHETPKVSETTYRAQGNNFVLDKACVYQ